MPLSCGHHLNPHAREDNKPKAWAVSKVVATCGSTPPSLLPQRHRQDEGASSAGARLTGQVPAMHAGYLSRQPEAEARALDVLRALRAAEAGEQLDLVFRADPHSPVDDGDRGQAVAAPDTNGDLGAGGWVPCRPAPHRPHHHLDAVP